MAEARRLPETCQGKVGSALDDAKKTVTGVVLVSTGSTGDSKTLEYGPRTIYAGFPSFLGLGVGGQ